MNGLSAICLSTLLLSYPSYDYRKNDREEGSSYIGQAMTTIPVEKSDDNEADSYMLNFYLEEENVENVGIRELALPVLKTSPGIVAFEHTSTELSSYRMVTEISHQMGISAGADIGITEMLGVNVSWTLNFMKTTSLEEYFLSSETTSTGDWTFVDGGQTPFGIYTYLLMFSSADRYYVSWSHTRFTNYGQPGEYQTIKYYETADCHIYLPNDSTYIFATTRYFEDWDEYNAAKSQWLWD